MKPKIIHRANCPEEIALVPSEEGGIFTGIIRDENGEGFLDAVGRGILLDASPEDVSLMENNLEANVSTIVRINPQMVGAYILVPFVKGTLYETITRHGELVDSHELAMNTFAEYIPYRQGN